MTSEELSDSVKEFLERFDVPSSLVRMCVERILNEGNAQYSLGDQQVFELLPIEKLSFMFDEEVADVLVYVVMLCIRLEAWNFHVTIDHLETFAGELIDAYRSLREPSGEAFV